VTTFDKREQAFEAKFVHDEELRFKVTARRNKLLGNWAANQLGLAGPAAAAYANDLVIRGLEAQSDPGMLLKLSQDLAATIGISERLIAEKMDEFLHIALEQIKSGS
jgi:hypothetical protein